MNYSLPFALSLGKDVASLPAFQGVEPDVMRDLMATAHTAQYQKGTVFLAQGEQVLRYYMMLEGWCGASKGNAEGQETILQLFRRGDFLFESAAEVPVDFCPMNLLALTQVHLLTLSPTAVRDAVKRSPIFAANVLAASIQQCQNLRDHIEHLTLHNAEQRVGRFLLQLRLNTGSGGTDIVLPFDKSLIATYLGIKPETLSRVFQVFRERGFTIERSHLTMPSRQALCVYCDKAAMRICPFANTENCLVAAKNTGIAPSSGT